MKGKITALIIGIVLGTAAVAGAATNFTSLGSAYGIKCYKEASVKMIACTKNNGSGYMVGISNGAVAVLNTDTEKIVFTRAQP